MLRRFTPTRTLILVIGAVGVFAAPALAQDSTSAGPVPTPDNPVSVSNAAELGRLLQWMQPCVLRARETYADAKARFAAGLPARHEFSVAARIRDGEGHIEQVFIRVEEIEGALIQGWVDSEVAVVEGFARGAPIWLAEDELVDWVIVSPDGRETGNLIGRNLHRVRNTPPPGDQCRPDI